MTLRNNNTILCHPLYHVWGLESALIINPSIYQFVFQPHHPLLHAIGLWEETRVSEEKTHKVTIHAAQDIKKHQRKCTQVREGDR